MLSLLILWTASIVIFTIIGTPILHICNLHNCLPKLEDRVFVAIWLGMIVLANLLLFASLFVPLTLYVMAFFVAIMAVPFFLKRSEYVFAGCSINLATACALFGVALAALVSTTVGQDGVEDTGLYHHQMINWLADYGSVQGLALINNPFGYTNAWFALTAPLQTGWLRHHFITGMNGFIFCLMALQTVLILRRVLNFNQSASVSDWFFVVAFALFCRFSFYDLILSPSPDIPVAMLVLIAAWLIVAISVPDSKIPGNTAIWPGAAVLIMAAGAVSFKLGAIPLLGAALVYYVLADGFAWRKLYSATLIVAPFAVIHLWISTVTSGCPLYPAPYFCTDSPWSLGSDFANHISVTTLEFLKWVGPTPPDATSFNWLWHTPPNKNFYNDKPLMLGLLVANTLCGAWLYIRRNRLSGNAMKYTTLVALAGIAFTIFKLPHLRFGLGFFLVIPALACASGILDLSALNNAGIACLKKFRAPLLLVVVYFTISPMATALATRFTYASSDVVLKDLVESAPELAIWPADAVPPSDGKVMKSNNFLYYLPTKSATPGEPALCWGSKLPCAQGVLNDVWLRDEKAGLAGGFVRHASAN